MSDNDERAARDEAEPRVIEAAQDPRKPYEAPRLVKKRSVARATLFTAMGGAMGTLTAMG